MYSLLLKVRKINEYISKVDEISKDTVEVEFTDIDDIQTQITFDIVALGMDNEDTVNAYGIQLYNLYDEIYDQIP
jgi:hypothetical protein